MGVLTPITGKHALARIVPFPSPASEKLPPASPLPIPQEGEPADGAADGEESQTSQVMRYTPRDPPSITEDDPTATQAHVDT